MAVDVGSVVHCSMNKYNERINASVADSAVSVFITCVLAVYTVRSLFLRCFDTVGWVI